MSENLFEPVMLVADIIGSDEYPDINGRISFKKKLEGVLVTAEIFGLPKSNAICDRKIFALHIYIIIFFQKRDKKIEIFSKNL